jgi:hypothetical protein
LPLFAWIALVFSAVFSLSAIARAGLRGWSLWRELRSFTGAAGAAVDELAKRAEATGRRAGAAAENAARLTTNVARLQSSLARLALLQAAAGEAGALFTGLRASVPRK